MTAAQPILPPASRDAADPSFALVEAEQLAERYDPMMEVAAQGAEAILAV